MTFSGKSFAIIILGLLPFCAFGQESNTSNHSEDAGKIINAISLGEQVNETAQEFHSQFEQNPLGLEPAQNKRMMDLFKQVFSQEHLLNDIRHTFEKNYNAEYADSVLNWAQSDSIQKVLDTKKSYYSLQGVRERVVNKYELEQHPPSKERKALIDSLASITAISQSEVEASATMFRAIVKAFSQLSDQRTFNDAQIESFVNNYRNQISSQMDQEINTQFMVMYHGLDSDLLRQYISFYTSRSGQWLKNTTSKSMQSAVEAASDRFLNSIGNIKSDK